MYDVRTAEAEATAGAPEHEIEVTPEMIGAGAVVVMRELPPSAMFSFGLTEDLSESVLRAALSARP